MRKAFILSAALIAGCGPEPEPSPGETSDVSCARVPGTICTFAGTGVAGLGAEELPPTDTELYLPQDVSFGPDGRAYVLDWNNHRVRMVDHDDVMRTLIGTGRLGDGMPGPALETSLNHPTHVSFSPGGELILAAWHNSKILRYDFDSEEVHVVTGNGERSYGGDGANAEDAILDLPVATAFAPDGSMYIADQGNQRIRKIGLDGIIDTVVGTGQPGFAGDGGPAELAQINLPTGQQAPPTGRISTDAEGNLFIVDTGNGRVRKVDVDGVITTVAGNGEKGYGGEDVTATESPLNHPNDAEVDADGNLYIADTNNSCVRKVSPDGVMTTAAGVCGERGRDGDGGPAAVAHLNRPYGVALDADGNLFVADTHNHLIRVIWR